MISQEISQQLYDSLKVVRNKPIEDLMEKPVLIQDDVHLSKIIGLMDKEKVHEVFVQLPDKSILCLDTRDTLRARDINTIKASTIGKRIPTLTQDDNLGNASRIMSLHRLRSLLILDNKNDKAIGQITSKRIIQYIHETIMGKKISIGNKITASDLMTPNLITLGPGDKIATAKNIMVKDLIDHLPVIEKKEGEELSIKGMITSRDIMQILIPSERISRDTLGSEGNINRTEIEVMGVADKNIIEINPQEGIISVIELLLKTNSTYVIVKSLDTVLGIITYRDIVSLLGEQIQSDIPAYIIGLPEDPFEAELAKSKFMNMLTLLKKISPDIIEARCKIKIRDSTGERKRYEVSVNIITPYRMHTYTSQKQYELARIFDEMSDSFKNQFSRRKSDDKHRESIRYSSIKE